MLRAGRALAGVAAVLAAGCSSAEDAGAPPATPDEQRALAEARAMIPASELPPTSPEARPTATESTPDAE